MTMFKRFRWTDDEMSLKMFVKQYSKQLPVLVMTTSGYAGSDGEMHEVGSEEVKIHIYFCVCEKVIFEHDQIMNLTVISLPPF